MHSGVLISCAREPATRSGLITAAAQPSCRKLCPTSRGEVGRKYIRIESTPTAVILAITDQGEVLCERQFKRGVGGTILTLVAEELSAASVREKLQSAHCWKTPATQVDECELLAETVTHAASWAVGLVVLAFARPLP